MENLSLTSNFLFSLDPIRFGLGVAIVLLSTWLLKYAYRTNIKSFDNKEHLIGHLDYFAVAIFVIVSVIKTSLALSLGLVGALSIIRFRTAIKEPGQIILLLFVTSVALSVAAEKEIIGLTISLFYLVKSRIQSVKEKEQIQDTQVNLRINLSRADFAKLGIIERIDYTRIYISGSTATLHFLNIDREKALEILSSCGDIVTEYEIS